MGACGSSKDRRKDKIIDKTPDENSKKNQDHEDKTPMKGEIIEITDNPKKEEVDKPLRNVRNGRSEYNYELKDLLKNNEVKDKISRDSVVFELLNRSNLRSNCDFIIEFENNYKIGYDKINVKFGDLMEEVFKNDIPEIILIRD